VRELLCHIRVTIESQGIENEAELKPKSESLLAEDPGPDDGTRDPVGEDAAQAIFYNGVYPRVYKSSALSHTGDPCGK
jgi:hypothetical protein